MQYIGIQDCKERGLYKLESRNLSVGVFKAPNVFIGIRYKLGDTFLDWEIHRDSRGTVTPLEFIEECPEDLDLKLSLGSKDLKTGRLVGFDSPISQGGRGWYFLDSGESSRQIRSCRIPNTRLFEYLNTK